MKRDYGIRVRCPAIAKRAFRNFPSTDTCIKVDIDDEQPVSQAEVTYQVFKEINAVALYMTHYLDPFVPDKEDYGDFVEATCQNVRNSFSYFSRLNLHHQKSVII